MSKHVLIATASKHGSTFDIADEIARVLTARGFVVTDKPIEEVGSVTTFDAVVVGSAVYVGRWMAEAVAFISRHATALAARPVWLFSSGPIGEPPKPTEDPSNLAEMVAQTGARGHRIFAGRLEPERLGLGERAIVAMIRAPKGDFRDFAEIGAWAAEIADELSAYAPAANGEGLLTAAEH